MSEPVPHCPGVAVEIRFTAGRYHANPWGRHVNEGAVEWPPSPWRFLRALIAVWRADGSTSEPAVRSLMAKLAAAPSFQLVPTTTAHLRHYVPYKDSQRLLLDPFVVVQDAITITWPGCSLIGEEEAVLEGLLEQLTYLGRAESWCQCRRVSLPTSLAQARPLQDEEPFGGTTVTLLCAQRSATLEQLEITTGEVQRRRLNRPPGSEWVTYAIDPKPLSETPSEPRPQLAIYLLRSSTPIPEEQTLRLSDRIRRELLRRHGDRHSPVFGGKISGVARADNHQHLHVLPDGGGESIERVLLWAPGGFGPSEVEVLRTLSGIPAQGCQEKVQLLPWTLIEQPGEETFGRSASWKSSSPYIPARHPKTRERDSIPEQIRRECQQRGLPEPTIEITDTAEGWVSQRHDRPKPAGPPQMVSLKFPNPIPGPLLLGADSHFGMGRFEPDQEG